MNLLERADYLLSLVVSEPPCSDQHELLLRELLTLLELILRSPLSGQHLAALQEQTLHWTEDSCWFPHRVLLSIGSPGTLLLIFSPSSRVVWYAPTLQLVLFASDGAISFRWSGLFSRTDDLKSARLSTSSFQVNLTGWEGQGNRLVLSTFTFDLTANEKGLAIPPQWSCCFANASDHPACREVVSNIRSGNLDLFWFRDRNRFPRYRLVYQPLSSEWVPVLLDQAFRTRPVDPDEFVSVWDRSSIRPSHFLERLVRVSSGRWIYSADGMCDLLRAPFSCLSDLFPILRAATLFSLSVLGAHRQLQLALPLGFSEDSLYSRILGIETAARAVRAVCRRLRYSGHLFELDGRLFRPDDPVGVCAFLDAVQLAHSAFDWATSL